MLEVPAHDYIYSLNDGNRKVTSVFAVAFRYDAGTDVYHAAPAESSCTQAKSRLLHAPHPHRADLELGDLRDGIGPAAVAAYAFFGR